MLIAFCVACLNAVAFYMILSYMPTYLSTELGMGETESFISHFVAAHLHRLYFLHGQAVGQIWPQNHVDYRLHRVHLGHRAFVQRFTRASFWAIVAIQIAFGFMLAMNFRHCTWTSYVLLG